MRKTRSVYIVACNTDIDSYMRLYIRKPKKCHVADYEYMLEITIEYFDDLFNHENIHEAENFFKFMRGYISLFDKNGLLI